MNNCNKYWEYRREREQVEENGRPHRRSHILLALGGSEGAREAEEQEQSVSMQRAQSASAWGHNIPGVLGD